MAVYFRHKLSILERGDELLRNRDLTRISRLGITVKQHHIDPNTPTRHDRRVRVRLVQIQLGRVDPVQLHRRDLVLGLEVEALGVDDLDARHDRVDKQVYLLALVHAHGFNFTVQDDRRVFAVGDEDGVAERDVDVDRVGLGIGEFLEKVKNPLLARGWEITETKRGGWYWHFSNSQSEPASWDRSARHSSVS